MDVHFRYDQRVCGLAYALCISNDPADREFFHEGFQAKRMGKWIDLWIIHHGNLCGPGIIDYDFIWSRLTQ